MFTPSAVIGMWFRGLVSVAVISGAVCLFRVWYRELPETVAEVQTLPKGEVVEVGTPRSHGAIAKISAWRPGLDKPTALLTGAVFLSMLALGAARLSYPLFRRLGKDEPSSSRSDRRIALRRPDGTEINVEEFGKTDGPAVILTHGWGMDSTEWYYAKKELAKEHRVVVWDLPGVGLSTRAANNDYSMERFATDLRAIVEWTAAPRVVLVGHSIGGMILQTYAQLIPNGYFRGRSGAGAYHLYEPAAHDETRGTLFRDRKTRDRAAALSDNSFLTPCLAHECAELSQREHASVDGQAIILRQRDERPAELHGASCWSNRLQYWLGGCWE